MADDLPITYSIARLAQITGLSESTLRREIASGKLRASRIRRRLVVLGVNVTEWLTNAEVRPAERIRVVRRREPMTRDEVKALRDFVRGSERT